jgi:hypothetical protein
MHCRGLARRSLIIVNDAHLMPDDALEVVVAHRGIGSVGNVDLVDEAVFVTCLAADALRDRRRSTQTARVDFWSHGAMRISTLHERWSWRLTRLTSIWLACGGSHACQVVEAHGRAQLICAAAARSKCTRASRRARDREATARGGAGSESTIRL